ncbi:hypothetical protein ACJMK2_019435 [Sinanodonta woodiana]|uniref:LRRCT domain-containing protein n=1 Tax=Sinanodonta woodiana TaxID=1069815 RepID=A0ABD3UGE3_SINWO
MNAESFSGLTSLTNVFLEAEFLDKTFPAGMFSKLSAVTTITIRSSSLNSIPPGAFDGLPNLVSLDLSRNQLWSLPVGAFDSLVSLMTLKLDGNNWNCGCHFTWLSRWLASSGINVTLTCSTPAAYKGVPLNRVIAALGCTTCTTCTTAPVNLYVLEATVLLFSSMALVVAALMGIALCYYRSTSKAKTPETIQSGKSSNQGSTLPKQSSNQGSTLPKQLSDNVKKTSEEMNKSRERNVEKTDNGSNKCKCQCSLFVRQVIVSPRPLIDVEYRKMPPLFPGFHSHW